MNDITDLAQREKFEAWWERTQHNGNPPRFGWSHWREGEGYKVDDDDSELDGMWEVWKAASAELVDELEKALRYIEELREWNAGLAQESFERQQLISELEPIRAAAEKLVRCKGRYHSEQNYRALAALFGVTVPDLPPLETEARTVSVKLPPCVDDLHGIGMVMSADAVTEALSAAGIKVEAE